MRFKNDSRVKLAILPGYHSSNVANLWKSPSPSAAHCCHHRPAPTKLLPSRIDCEATSAAGCRYLHDTVHRLQDGPRSTSRASPTNTLPCSSTTATSTQEVISLMLIITTHLSAILVQYDRLPIDTHGFRHPSPNLHLLWRGSALHFNIIHLRHDL